jgi:PKD repeat protein
VGTHTYTVTCTNISGTASDSVTIYVVAPLSGTITVTYARLLLFAPNLGQPGQTLSGTVIGGEPPYSITVHVRAPSGVEISLSRSGPTWSATPQNSGDINFGTTEQGIWTAWSDLTDSAGRTYRTSSVTWEVAWHPVHGRP